MAKEDDKKDCMFYNKDRADSYEHGCTALNVKECKNCNFYKYSDNAEADRAKIAKECADYQAIH